MTLSLDDEVALRVAELCAMEPIEPDYRNGAGDRNKCFDSHALREYSSYINNEPGAKKMTITRQYPNLNNGGKERITRDGDAYYINSYLSAEFGWTGQRKVSREQAAAGMSYTKAPADVVAAILA